nr:nucleotidyltransferase family protein [Paenibacillus phyllosphaerae]
MQEQRLISLIEANPRLMADLRLVREIVPEEAYISAGYIRNYAWDVLHGYDARDKHTDIDVVYYNRDQLGEERDLAYEQRLIQATGRPSWSVKNQARMHLRNDDAPYDSLEDALSRWPETATAIGARIDEEDRIHFCAPYGLEDLFALKLRQSPLFLNRDYYRQRVSSKNWRADWPLLQELEGGES